MTDEERVTCQRCGQTVEKRRCCGVKSGPAWVWTCETCILAGGMDRVFAPIGRTVRRAMSARAGKLPARMGDDDDR